MDTTEEIWKDIAGYEGLYQVSNFGRIKSLERSVNDNGGNNLLKERILKPFYVSGYYSARLYINRSHKDYRVHRLVAQAFITNPYNLPIINHKDENRLNNTVENLEWCTYQYNNTYGTVIEKQIKSHLNHKDLSKPVLCIELNKIFPSIHEAGRWLGDYHLQAHICECCNGKRKTCYNYHWKYVD